MTPSLVFLLRGLTLRETLVSGVLLSARLSLIFTVATVGVELGLFDDESRAIAILLAAVTTMICPTLFRLLAPRLPAEARGSQRPGLTSTAFTS